MSFMLPRCSARLQAPFSTLQKRGVGFYSKANSPTAGKLHMIILGAPGSGKGTQSERLVKKWDIKTIGVGDLLRQEIVKETALGVEAEATMRAGGLLPDEIVLELVKPKLLELKEENWLLDGFPRKASQAALLDKLLAETPGGELNLVVNLAVPDEVILERIEGRWVHAPSGRMYNNTFNPPKVPGKDDITHEPLSKRPDDNAVTFGRRLDSYHAENNPLLAHYADTTAYGSDGKSKLPKLVTLSGRTSNEIWPKLEGLISERYTLPLK